MLIPLIVTSVELFIVPPTSSGAEGEVELIPIETPAPVTTVVRMVPPTPIFNNTVVVIQEE